MADPIIIPAALSRVYDKLIEAHADLIALERVAEMKDLDPCKDCTDGLEVAEERRDAVCEALAAVLNVRCPCCPNHVLNAYEIKTGCPKCKAKVVLEV
jgi:hypothetical protein